MSELSELIKSLEAATALVADVVAGRISPKDFIQEYGNFYYYNALDGHEATPD